MEEKTEGLLLHATAYLGRQKILKIFTPMAGLVSLFAKKEILSMGDPFRVGEWVYRRGREDLHLLCDATLIDDLANLRNDFATLQAAGCMARDLLRSELPAKNGPKLYALALAYLRKLPFLENPDLLAQSFRLKLLLHEGLFAIQKTCLRCSLPTEFLSRGESLCAAHAPLHCKIPFTQEEIQILQLLALARRFDQLTMINHIPQNLATKIAHIFEERME